MAGFALFGWLRFLPADFFFALFFALFFVLFFVLKRFRAVFRLATVFDVFFPASTFFFEIFFFFVFFIAFGHLSVFGVIRFRMTEVG